MEIEELNSDFWTLEGQASNRITYLYKTIAGVTHCRIIFHEYNGEYDCNTHRSPTLSEAIEYAKNDILQEVGLPALPNIKPKQSKQASSVFSLLFSLLQKFKSPFKWVS